MFYKINASAVATLCHRHKHATYESVVESLIPSDVLCAMKKSYVEHKDDIILPQTKSERMSRHKKMIQQSSSSLANVNAFVEKKSISTQDISQVCSISTFAPVSPLEEETPTQKEISDAIRSVAFCKRGTHLEPETIDILHKFWSEHEGINVVSKPGSILRRVLYFSAAEGQDLSWNSVEEMQACDIPPPYYSIVGRVDALMKDNETGDIRGIIEIKNRMYKFSPFGAAPMYDMDQLCVYMMLFQDMNVPYGYLAEQYDGSVIPSVEMMTNDEANIRWSTILKPLLDEAVRDVQSMCDDPTSERSREFISNAI